MKKIIIVLVVMLALVVTGCGSSSKKSDNNKNAKGIENVSKGDTKANIKEQVILDENGVKITMKSIDYSSRYDVEIKLLVENNTDDDISVQVDDLSINDIMIYPVFYANVNAGKKVNETIDLSKEDLELANITTIGTIELSINVYNPNTWKDITTKKGIKVETDAKNYVQKYNTDGKLLYDQEGIKIYFLKLDQSNSLWGADMYLYIENNTKQNITVQANDVSVNGYMIDPMFSATVNAGKKIYDTITFFNSDLDKNEITDIKEVELKFDIFDPDTWEDIVITGAKKITF